MNYQRNKKYFLPSPIMYGIIMIVVGLLGLIGFSQDGGQVCGVLGLVLAGLGGFIVFRGTTGKPSDSELDAVCLGEIANIKQKALAKLGIDEEEVKLIQPVQVHGYTYDPINTPVLFKTGKDNANRSSNYEAMILFFGENQVHSYKYVFSIVADEHSEYADEYFYKDIVTVSTASEKQTIKLGKLDKTINYEAFKLVTTGGNAMVCAVRDVGGTEKSIHGMRQLLRQKKTG